jgi:hypothetical protein
MSFFKSHFTPSASLNFRPAIFAKLLGLLKLKCEFYSMFKYHSTNACTELGTGIRLFETSGDWLYTDDAVLPPHGVDRGYFHSTVSVSGHRVE